MDPWGGPCVYSSVSVLPTVLPDCMQCDLTIVNCVPSNHKPNKPFLSYVASVLLFVQW